MRIYRDVVYANELGYRSLELDLYLPTDSSRSVPLALFVHGAHG